MTQQRRLANFALLVVIVGAGVYFVSRYWTQVADSVPATTVLTGSGAAGRTTGGTGRPAASSTTAQVHGGAPTSSTAAAGTPSATGTSSTSTTSASLSSSTSATSSAVNALAAAQLRRSQAESREIDQLRGVATDTSVNATVRAQAEEQLVQLEQFQEEESLAEVVLSAKGFTDAVVLLHAGGATVLVPSGPFNAQKAAMVAQAVASVAGLDPSQVQIVPTA
jgi:stage III sporulation protein AH